MFLGTWSIRAPPRESSTKHHGLAARTTARGVTYLLEGRLPMLKRPTVGNHGKNTKGEAKARIHHPQQEAD